MKHLISKTMTAVPVLALALAVGGCGSSNDTMTGTTPPPSEPTAEELAQQRADEQMALITSASSGLTTALMALDTDAPTAAQIAAVDAAISVLENALAGATDLSPNQTAAARSQLSTAMTTVATARTTAADATELATRRANQMTAISTAQTDLATALAALMADDAASIDAVNDAITALQGAVDAADDLTEAETMSAMSDLMDAEVSAAKAEVDMYTAATMAEGATDEEMLAAYEGQLAAATRHVAALEANNGSAADINAGNQLIGSATAKVANLKEKIQMAKGDEANKARLASNLVSMQVAAELNAHTLAGNPSAEFLVPGTALAGTGDTNFGISRTSGDAKVALTQTAADKKAKPYMMPSAPSAGNGWMGQTFTRSSESGGTSGKRPVTEMASVYTDIEMSGDMAWADYFAADADDATGVVTLSRRAADKVERISSGILPAAPAGSDASNTRTIALATKARPTRISGSYYGVAGTYTCAATTLCTVARDRNGVLEYVGLMFAPTLTPTDVLAGTTATVKAKYVDPDMDYTYFGYWMESTTQRDDTKKHMIETFNGGMGETAIAADSIAGVEGTAKYYGSAAGVYVKKMGADDSLVVTDGTFTADAMLTASFGGDAIAVSKQDMVSGTISNFMDGSMDLGFADLALGAGSIAVVAPTNPAVDDPALGAITGGETNGGGTSGNWSGQFYGNLNPTPDGGTDDFTDDYPINVSGEFNGHFTDGHVAGAFGAEIDD